MGGTQRLAAVAAVSHARHYNHTQDSVLRTESAQYGVNVFFISATLCGVVIAVCAACWPRSPAADKPEDARECAARVYTVSDDNALHTYQMQASAPEPPPTYDSVVDTRCLKNNFGLQEIVVDRNPLPQYSVRPDSSLPSYDAAVMLRDTKL